MTYDKATREAVRRDYKAGVLIKEICKDHGVGRVYVWSVTRDLPARRRGKRPAPVGQVHLDRFEAYQSGVPVREIAAREGVSRQAVYESIGRARDG